MRIGYRQGKHPVDEICRNVGVSRPTLYVYIHEANIMTKLIIE
jgi:AcrR family transcriptional regulator